MGQRYQIGRHPHRLMFNSKDSVDPKSEDGAQNGKRASGRFQSWASPTSVASVVTGGGYAHVWGRLGPPSSRPAATMAVTIPEYPVQRQI